MISSKTEKLCNSLSEWEILQSLGYDRIWDCGKIRWRHDALV
jgi:hypothetical protein